MKVPSRILPVIVFAQFCCTSLWFAGNAVMPELTSVLELSSNALSLLTSAVQSGFILGTLLFAFLSISDKFSPTQVFFLCAIFGSIFNLATILEENNLYSLMIIRFLVGFSLAGIYPVGMKIASDHFEKGLGRSLGFLVGALVLGTGFPHLLKATSEIVQLSWNVVIISTSALALSGGLLLRMLVPDGPFRKPHKAKNSANIFKLFQNSNFRSAAFGYFGHMWELYAFWAFVPFMLKIYNHFHPDSISNIPLYSFLIIGSGAVACAISGILSERFGVAHVARTALIFSGICCLISPLLMLFASEVFFIIFLIFWGVMVIADSPLFSTLIARSAPAEGRGTALTLVNSIGYAITILSIQIVGRSQELLPQQYMFVILAAGPILGVIYIKNFRSKSL
ncbi:nitrate/nitrite transporter [uncultured Christiangramia sp.]|uniref:MFS transporter n=1 Tax=uncultured Christiangramia sp. TaxID=503836 RepID=UPI002639DDCE|nr:MFS transporter [uncultured Christiangramia sp.]